MELKGFLRWWLGTPREWIRDPYFWAAVTIWTGIGFQFAEYTHSGRVILAGIILFFVAILADWVRVSYRIYRMEREQIINRLKR